MYATNILGWELWNEVDGADFYVESSSLVRRKNQKKRSGRTKKNKGRESGEGKERKKVVTYFSNRPSSRIPTIHCAAMTPSRI
jgi:hypothetical protein